MPSFGALIWGNNKGTAGPGLPGSQQQVGLEESDPSEQETLTELLWGGRREERTRLDPRGTGREAARLTVGTTHQVRVNRSPKKESHPLSCTQFQCGGIQRSTEQGGRQGSSHERNQPRAKQDFWGV